MRIQIRKLRWTATSSQCFTYLISVFVSPLRAAEGTFAWTFIFNSNEVLYLKDHVSMESSVSAEFFKQRAHHENSLDVIRKGNERFLIFQMFSGTLAYFKSSSYAKLFWKRAEFWTWERFTLLEISTLQFLAKSRFSDERLIRPNENHGEPCFPQKSTVLGETSMRSYFDDEQKLH